MSPSLKELSNQTTFFRNHESSTSVNNSIGVNYDDLLCYDNEYMDSMVEFLFILSLIMQHAVVVIAIIGVLMNSTAMYVLCTRKTMKNTFNTLLISLYCCDTLFLCTYVYLSLTLSYMKTPYWIQTILSRFVKLIYSATFKCSIFLTVATSHERFIAMHHPIIHSAYMSSERSRQIRLLKYLIPITASAIILIIPEYMESEFVWKLKNSSRIQEMQHANTR